LEEEQPKNLEMEMSMTTNKSIRDDSMRFSQSNSQYLLNSNYSTYQNPKCALQNYNVNKKAGTGNNLNNMAYNSIEFEDTNHKNIDIGNLIRNNHTQNQVRGRTNKNNKSSSKSKPKKLNSSKTYMKRKSSNSQESIEKDQKMSPYFKK
jgi:hypothetical protein